MTQYLMYSKHVHVYKKYIRTLMCIFQSCHVARAAFDYCCWSYDFMEDGDATFFRIVVVGSLVSEKNASSFVIPLKKNVISELPVLRRRIALRPSSILVVCSGASESFE